MILDFIGPIHHGRDRDPAVNDSAAFFDKNGFFCSLFHSAGSCGISAYSVEFSFAEVT